MIPKNFIDLAQKRNILLIIRRRKVYWRATQKEFTQTHRDGCHFSFFLIHIFSTLSHDAFAEKLFPSSCFSLLGALTCVFLCVFKKNKMKKSQTCSEAILLIFCVWSRIASSFSSPGTELRIDDAWWWWQKKSSSRNFQVRSFLFWRQKKIFLKKILLLAIFVHDFSF